MAESVPVPFFTIRGNRRCLTRYQIENDPALAAFVRRFKGCFEVDPQTDVFMFIEDGDKREHAAPTFVKP